MQVFRPRSSLLTFPLLLLLITPGCEVGRSWFSMNSNSPMPFFGVDLLPRRKTSQMLPQAGEHPEQIRPVSTKSARPFTAGESEEPRSWSRDLHLPSIPAFFDGANEERLSFDGPQGPFSR